MAIDISDGKRTGDAERQAAELRAAASLAAGVVHEINKPAAVIVGYLDSPVSSPRSLRIVSHRAAQARRRLC